MSKHFRFYYIFNGYQYRHGLTAKDIVEAKSKAQRHLDEWNAVRNSVRVLEWVEEVK